MVFPVLELPAVALGQVLRGFTSSDLFEMHQCSLKTGHALKQFQSQIKTIKTNVDFQRKWVDVKGVHRYQVCTAEENQGVVPETTRFFDGEEVPFEMVGGKAFNTFWPADKKDEGLMHITTDLIRSLGLTQLESILIDKSSSAQEVLQWIDRCQVKMENFNLVNTVRGNEDALADIIYTDEFFRKVSMNFVSLLEVSPEYTAKNWKISNTCINLFQLHLQDSHWLTLEHLLAFNTGSIVLYRSKLSNADLKKYLKLWKEQNYTRLQYMSINLTEGQKFDIREIIGELVEPNTIRVEEDQQEFVTLNRPDKVGELSLNADKTVLTYFVDDVPKPNA
ncbi:unnamed protein product [Caenorhabditis brenneri]